jgi:hypothetical protein
MHSYASKAVWTIFGSAAALLIIGAACVVTSRPAAATAQFAAATGQSCAACHTDPKGGGALTPAGAAFKANGNKLPNK